MSMTGQPGGPPPGWYPDPAGGGGVRWWDGTSWTWHTAAPPRVPEGLAPRSGPAAPWTRPRLASAGPVVERELRLAGWARLSVAAVAALGVAYAFLPLEYSSALASLFHWFRDALHASQAASHPQPPPVPAISVSYLRLAYAGDLVYVAVGVVFLVWQYRAAEAARRLGLPALHRPSWGVAFWFIPFANLWCPYQALRDCLPPRHPGRRSALGCWLAYLGAGCVSVAIVAAAPYHRPVAVGLLVADALLFLFVAVEGARLIGAVGIAHRELAAR